MIGVRSMMTTQPGKKVAIMQPYLLPYIGYFQLINAVDLFIVYDNIKYTKKGWINRNRMLVGRSDSLFSIPLKKDSDSLNICERELATDFNRCKLLNQFKEAYRKAPHFAQTVDFIEQVLMNEESSLFGFLHACLLKTCERLGISTPILVSSTLNIDHSMQSQDKVIALCRAVGAATYINPIGGLSLYSQQSFVDQGLELRFLESGYLSYPQFGNEFVPWLSIVDVMMFNTLPHITDYLNNAYNLSQGMEDGQSTEIGVANEEHFR